MSARPSQPTDPAVRVWTAMYEFVAAQDRRKPLRDVLDLGPGKVQLLVMLADGPMTLRDIAEAFGIDAPAATVTIDKLQARGLVKRTPHPDDNRRKLVHLTDPGREAAARGQQILTEPPAALAGLSAEDLAQLEDIMSRLDRMPPSPPALDQRLTPHPLDEPDSLICPATLRPKDHAMIHILGTEFVHFYLLEEDGEITLVDARVSGYLDTLEPALARMGRSIDDVKAIVLTHADPDHVGFAGELQRSHGIPVYVHRADSDRTRQGNTKKTEGSPLAMFPMLRHAHGRRALRHMIANGGAKQTKVSKVIPFDGGDELDAPGRLRVIHTPGHTDGHCVLYAPSHDALFVGDAVKNIQIVTGKPGAHVAPTAANTSTDQAYSL